MFKDKISRFHLQTCHRPLFDTPGARDRKRRTFVRTPFPGKFVTTFVPIGSSAKSNMTSDARLPDCSIHMKYMRAIQAYLAVTERFTPGRRSFTVHSATRQDTPYRKSRQIPHLSNSSRFATLPVDKKADPDRDRILLAREAFVSRVCRHPVRHVPHQAKGHPTAVPHRRLNRLWNRRTQSAMRGASPVNLSEDFDPNGGDGRLGQVHVQPRGSLAPCFRRLVARHRHLDVITACSPCPQHPISQQKLTFHG